MINQKGFTLYISIVISAAVLLGAYAVSDSLLRQHLFSADYYESQRAFAMAEAGVACARAYDLGLDAFNEDESYKGSIQCGDTEMVHGADSFRIADGNVIIGGATNSIFELHSGDACVVVMVNKDPLYPNTVSLVESEGYSECVSGDNPRRIQRAVRARY
jgi:hypothetical protein